MQPTYALDVYLNHTHSLAIVIRRQEPYVDEEGVYHSGSIPGINTWFAKMRYARSGNTSAAISAQTATSHALFFTQPEDWEECIDFVTDIERDEVNNMRQEVAQKLENKGYTFVGRADHKLGKSLGLSSPSKAKTLVKDLTQKQIRTRISKMLRYVPDEYKPAKGEENQLVNRCIRSNNKVEPIITVSDLFNEICSIVEANYQQCEA